ncbi:MAG: hypothetical protein CM15mP25_3230 [Gammaproteobacteria bacterium]|nr:MAG: hypothetical protein CM15mP25_3230 [Gammaproteobacteria bacterium]
MPISCPLTIGPLTAECPTERVQQVVDWLSLPADQRPDLVTLYFSVVDSASHTYGPTAPATLSAIVEVDRQIAVLWQAIESLNLREGTDINLMLVSDHGMSEVDPNLFIDTNTLPRPKALSASMAARGSRITSATLMQILTPCQARWIG